MLSLIAASYGQTQQVASVVHTRYTINSAVLGEERTILVRVPDNYERTDARYPVVYMLDAHPPQNAMMAGILEQQAWGGQIPEMILVGIQNTNRSRDLTPSDDGKGGSVGGGEKFLQFIEKEVIPLVEKNYRTQPYRIFAGHSLGGLAAIYCFSAHPDLFNAYIAASPTLSWDNNLVIRQAEKAFQERKVWNKTIFVGLGDEPDLSGGVNAFRDLLKKAKPKDLDYEFQQYPGENHASVVLRVYYAGLRKIYAGWLPPKSGSVAELEDHYKKLSERFGYTIPVPEELLNQIGYQFLRGGKVAEALSVFRRNAELYPNSANVYDSLAEALEKNGQTRQARETYEKAFKMAEAQGDEALANSSRKNFERLNNKQ